MKGDVTSFEKVLQVLFEHFRPNSILVVGGDFNSIRAASESLGCLEVCDASVHDLALPMHFSPSGQKFDLTICTDYAGTVPADSAEDLVHSLAVSSNVILFSAPLPFEGGIGHKNENWLEYWSTLFFRQGFLGLDIIRPRLWREPSVSLHLKQNAVVFANNETSAVFKDEKPDILHSQVHPELFMTAVRRFRSGPFLQTKDADMSYWNDLTLKAPGYGAEFASKQPVLLKLDSYLELKAVPRWKLPPVLADAIAPVKVSGDVRQLVHSTSAPDFIGVGVQKAATTWLYEVLRGHGEVYMPPGKELNFFNRRAFQRGSAWSGFGLTERMTEILRGYLAGSDSVQPERVKLMAHLMNPSSDQSWYETAFSLSPAGRVRGEITPEYAMLPEEVIKSILVFNPRMKFFLMLRDPVKRALSHLGMIADQAPESVAFLANIAKEASFLGRGRYEKLVPKWSKLVPAEQLLIGTQENLDAAPVDFLSNLANFLCIDPEKFPASASTSKVFVGSSSVTIPPEVIAYLEDEFAATRVWMADNLSF